MGLEIERKFLLAEVPDWLPRHDSAQIEQGYLAIVGDAELRLRRAGDEHTLTLKRGAGESREEFETSVTSGQAAALWPSTVGRLEKRRHRVPLEGELLAEVDVYAGALAGLAVVEVEFPDVARARGFEPPAWFGREVTGRAEYANQALATDGMPKGDRDGASRAYRLKRKESVGDGLRRIASGRAEKALERLRAAEAGGEDPASTIHGARKDLKKLRAAVRLARPALGASAYRKENRRYREAGRALSASRDAQVKLETLDALRDRGGDLPMAALAAWRHELSRELERTGGAAEDAALAEAAELIGTGRDEIDGWRLDRESWGLIAAGALRTYKRGRQAMRRAEDAPSATNLHDWRKRAKDLWYLLRLLERAWPEVLGETTEQTHRLTELLGDHHDLAVLAQDLTGRPLPENQVGALSAAIADRQDELTAEAFDLGHRLYAEKPKAFRRRLHAYWKAWRG